MSAHISYLSADRGCTRIVDQPSSGTARHQCDPPGPPAPPPPRWSPLLLRSPLLLGSPLPLAAGRPRGGYVDSTPRKACRRPGDMPGRRHGDHPISLTVSRRDGQQWPPPVGKRGPGPADRSDAHAAGAGYSSWMTSLTSWTKWGVLCFSSNSSAFLSAWRRWLYSYRATLFSD